MNKMWGLWKKERKRIVTIIFNSITNLHFSRYSVRFVTYYGNNEPTHVSNVFDSNSPLQYVYVTGLYMNDEFCGIPIKIVSMHTEGIPICYKYHHVLFKRVIFWLFINAATLILSILTHRRIWTQDIIITWFGAFNSNKINFIHFIFAKISCQSHFRSMWW